MSKYTVRLFAATIVASCLMSAFAQEDATRLLGASFAKTIAFAWRQDGRVVEIDLKNPKDKWVLQQLASRAYFPVEPSPSSTPPPGSSKKSDTPDPDLDPTGLVAY